MQKSCMKCRRSVFGPIFILTEYQSFGYAQEAIRQAEAEYPESILWELGKTERVKDGMDLVYYEKEV